MELNFAGIEDIKDPPSSPIEAEPKLNLEGIDKINDSVPPPNTTDYLLNQGAQGLATIGSGVMRGVAGLVNVVDPNDSADPIFEASDSLIKTAKSSFGVTPEQQESASFPLKVAGALTQGAAQLPLYANPATAVIAITAPALTKATEMIRENGIDVGDAQAIYGMNVATNAAGYKIATTFPNAVGATGREVAKNYAKAVTATPAMNVVSGGLEDYGTQRLLEDERPELANKFRWNNWEQRAIEGITGIAMGAGMKYLHDNGSKTNLEKILERKEAFEELNQVYKDTLPSVFNAIKEGAVDVAHGTQVGLRGAEKQFARAYKDIDERQHSQYSLADYIADIRKSDVAKNPEITDLIKTLEALENLDYSTITRSTVHIHNDKTAEGGVVHLNKDLDTPPEFAVTVPEILKREDMSTVVHEVGHVVTYAMLKKLEALTPEQLKKSPKLASLKEHIDGMKAAYDLAVLNAGKQVYERAMKQSPDWVRNNTDVELYGHKIQLFDHQNRTIPDFANLNDYLRSKKIASSYYGLTDFNEFIASSFEALNPKSVQDPLASRGLREFASNKRETLPLERWDPASSFEFKELYKQSASIFRDLGDNSFLKSMWDGVHRLASGQAKMNLDYKSILNKARDMDDYARHTLVEIGNVLRTSDSMPEFLVKLESMSSLPAWREFAIQNADLMFKNRHLIQAKVQAAETIREGQQIGAKGNTESYESVDELMKALPKTPSGEKDLPSSWNRWLISPNQRTLMNLPPVVGKILRFYHQQMAKYSEMEAKVFNSMMQHMDSYNMLPEASKKRVMDLGYFVDGSWKLRKEMEAREIWWPDEAMVKAINKEATPEEIHAYLQLGEMENRAYKLLEAIALKKGDEPPTRIPGHMPRVWKGAYKVFVQGTSTKTRPDGSTYDVNYTDRVMAFPNKWRAQAFAKEVAAGKYGKEFTVAPDEQGNQVRVQTIDDWEKGIIASMMQDQAAYKQFSTYAPEMQAKIMAMDNAHTIGYQKHLEDRSGVKGHLGEYGTDKNYTFTQRILGEKYRDYRDYLGISEKYAKGVVETFKNTMFVEDVQNRLFKNGTDAIENKRQNYNSYMEHFKVLGEHLSELTNNYTGHADNHFKAVDELLTDLSIKAGIPPYSYREVAKGIRNLISLVFTRYNPGNWIMNYVQPSHTMSILTFVNEQRRRQGLTVGDVGKVTGELFNKGKLDKDEQAALAWAGDNHILEAQQEYQVRNKATTRTAKLLETVSLGKIPTGIEGNARATSFMIAYKYFKQVHDDPTVARRAAAEAMGITMVNYDRSHRPLMYQSFGVTGELLSPFAVYRNAWMANTVMMVKFALQKPLEFNAWKPFLVSQALYVASAGLVGAIGLGEYDSLIRLLKQYSPDTFGEWPDAAGLLKQSKIPETARYGLLTQATKYFPGTPSGVSIGGSGAAVSLDDMVGVNTVPFIASLLSLSSLASKYATGKTPTASDKYEALSGVLPGQARFVMNKYFQEPNVKTRFAAKSLVGETHATYADDMSHAIWGKYSIPVQEEKTQIRQLKAVEQTHTTNVKRLVEKAVDALAGTNRGSYEEFAAEAGNNYGIEAKVFEEMVAQKRIERQLPYLDKLYNSKDSFVKQRKLDAYQDMGGSVRR
jgi:DNA-binding NarL/FixJ family response regulator